MIGQPVEAVLFDWGGTLTPWHAVDFEAEARALAAAVICHDGAQDRDEHVQLLQAANQAVWLRSRDHQLSSTVHDVFTVAGLDYDPSRLTTYYDFWEPHTSTDPHVAPLFAALGEQGIKVGVLSNTIWPREVHEGFFRRDGVHHLIDGDVYTSEVSWTKPAREVFHHAVEVVGATDPARCVYVGDRLFDDIWGAQNAGLRAIHVPHSTIPVEQVGHSVGVPDATVHSLAEVLDVLRAW